MVPSESYGTADKTVCDYRSGEEKTVEAEHDKADDAESGHWEDTDVEGTDGNADGGDGRDPEDWADELRLWKVGQLTRAGEGAGGRFCTLRLATSNSSASLALRGTGCGRPQQPSREISHWPSFLR